MRDDGMPAINLLTAPWSMMKKSVLKVSSKEYQSEITRRWNIMCAYDPDLKANCRWGIPRTNQWKLEKLQMWLNDNPMTDDGERAYSIELLLLELRNRGTTAVSRLLTVAIPKK
jgi:hypothetical protein